MNDTNSPTDSANVRAAAIKRLSAVRDFRAHVVAYVVVNAGLLAIWFVTGHGYFWPGWILGGWSISLVLHAWEVYGRRPISEEEIVREMSRRGGARA